MCNETKPAPIDAKTIEHLRDKLQDKMGKSISKKAITNISVSILWEQVNKRGCDFLFDGGLIDTTRLKQNRT